MATRARPRRRERRRREPEVRSRPSEQYVYTAIDDRRRRPAAHNVEPVTSGMPPEHSGIDEDPSFYAPRREGPGFFTAPYRADQIFGQQGSYTSSLDASALSAYDRQVPRSDDTTSWWEPEPERGQSHRGKGPRGYDRPDERILDDVCHSLTEDPDVDARDIEVEVKGAVIYLRGTVPDRAQKRRASNVAWDTLGARDVMNELRVRRH